MCGRIYDEGSPAVSYLVVVCVGGGVAIISHAPSAGGWVPGATAAGWRGTGRALELSPYGFPWLQIDAGSPLGWVLYLYCLLEKQWALGMGGGGGGCGLHTDHCCSSGLVSPAL